MEGWFWIDYASIASGGEHTLIGNNGTDTQMWFSVVGSNWGGPKYNFQTGTEVDGRIRYPHQQIVLNFDSGFI